MLRTAQQVGSLLLIPTALAEQRHLDEYPVGVVDDVVPTRLLGEPSPDLPIQGGQLAGLAGESEPGCVSSALERRGRGPQVGVHRREALLDGSAELAHLAERAAILMCRCNWRIVNEQDDGAPRVVLQGRRQQRFPDQRGIFLVRRYEDRHGRHHGRPKRIDLRIARRLMPREASCIAVARRKICQAAGHERRDQDYVRDGGWAHAVLLLQRYVDHRQHVLHGPRPCTQGYGDSRQRHDSCHARVLRLTCSDTASVGEIPRDGSTLVPSLWGGFFDSYPPRPGHVGADDLSARHASTRRCRQLGVRPMPWTLVAAATAWPKKR